MNRQGDNHTSYTQATPQPVVFPTSKRLACERCRHQKLRCPPRDHPTEPCSRCARLGTNCITGYPRPHGHIARKSSPARGRMLSRPELRLQPAMSLSQTEPPPMQCPKPVPSEDPPTPLSNSDSLDKPPPLSTTSNQGQPTFFSPSLEAVFADDTLFFSGDQNDETDYPLWPHFDDSYNLNTLPAVGDIRSNASIELDAVGVGEDVHHSSSSATPVQSSSVWEYDQRLSHLNLSCST
jgi:hypothetical protein